MKKILVPTDFSPNAQKAVNYAVQLAKKTGGELFLVHAAEKESMKDELTDAKDKMALRTSSIRETEKIKVTSKVVRIFPIDAILESIREYKIDWVVMGTLGNSALSEKILGSRTAAVIGQSPVPVLVIPLMSDWKIPGKILLSINDMGKKEVAIQSVMKMAQLFSASVQVAIFTDTDDDYVEDYRVHEQKIEEYRWVLKKQYPDVEIHAVHLAGRHFTENANNWITENGIDMMVMLTRRRNFLERLLQRSLTKKMSYRINIPLLAIPV